MAPKNSLNRNSMLCSSELSSQIKILVPDENKSRQPVVLRHLTAPTS